MKAIKVAKKLRVRIGRFSGELSTGLCLPAQRFVSEMVYGIQAAQSVLLTEIGRALEEPISLHKTSKRDHLWFNVMSSYQRTCSMT